MTDLDDLAEIAEANAFGFATVSHAQAARFRCGGVPPAATCKRGHPRTPENTRYRKYKSRKGTRRTCRICNNANRIANRIANRNASGMPTASEPQ